MAINKHKLVYDTVDGGDEVASFLKSSDGTLLTHTDVGGKKSLDVNVANDVEITATDLDIRDLDAAQDNVAISDGTDQLEINADGSINVAFASGAEIKITDGTDDLEINADGSINSVVTATDLDIRDLDFSTDSVDVSGSSVTVSATDLDIRDLAFATDSVDVSGSSVTVSATDLDIRDLDFATDSVDVTGSEVSLDATTLAALEDINVTTAFEKAEDAAHVSGDIGAFTLSVRQDSLSASAADGDYQAFKTDALGRQYINDATQTMAHSAVTVAVTATDLVGTDLVNRKRLLVQNVGNKDMYVGGASVTAANGIYLPKGSSIELDAGASVDLYAIAVGGSTQARVLELA
jgi:hypothetical protein